MNEGQKQKSHLAVAFLTCKLSLQFVLAEWTGLEPATPGVTGRYSNQLNYHSFLLTTSYQQSLIAF